MPAFHGNLYTIVQRPCVVGFLQPQCAILAGQSGVRLSVCGGVPLIHKLIYICNL